MRAIESRNNQNVKDIIKLIKSARERRERAACVVEGLRLCSDVASSKITIKQFYFTKQAQEQYFDDIEKIASMAVECFLVSDTVMKAISYTSTPQGLVCVCQLPECPPLDELDTQGCYICCENVLDPGNLGTILRTAEALGISGAILSKDCCDPFSPKVIRGSMGSVFRLPIYFSGNLAKDIETLNYRGMKSFAAVVDESATPVSDITFQKGSIVAIGNEANGLTKALIDSSSKKITLPMKGKAESLNAAIAAGILMWELTRRI